MGAKLHYFKAKPIKKDQKDQTSKNENLEEKLKDIFKKEIKRVETYFKNIGSKIRFALMRYPLVTLIYASLTTALLISVISCLLYTSPSPRD